METSPAVDSGLHEARRRLLEEGARSYVPAMTALIEYRREVHKVCRKILENRLTEFGSALGGSLDRQGIAEWFTGDDRWDAVEAAVGVKLENVGLLVELNSYFGLYWDYKYGGPPFGCYVGMWLKQRSHFDFVWKEFAKSAPEIGHGGKEIWIWRPLSDTDPSSFEDQLDTVLCTWIELWKQLLMSAWPKVRG